VTPEDALRPSALPVCLVGLPGVGKSTIGRRLARRLGRDFHDTDRHVEERVGCSIAALFDSHGEAAFRALEAQALSELLTLRPPAVIATGGGIVTHPPSRALLATSSVAVYLKSRPQHLARRLQRDTTRPLLRKGGVLENLLRLEAQRDPLYQEIADLVVETCDMSPSLVIARILIELDALEHRCEQATAQ
jgi:shikimate kinase